MGQGEGWGPSTVVGTNQKCYVVIAPFFCSFLATPVQELHTRNSTLFLESSFRSGFQTPVCLSNAGKNGLQMGNNTEDTPSPCRLGKPATRWWSSRKRTPPLDVMSQVLQKFMWVECDWCMLCIITYSHRFFIKVQNPVKLFYTNTIRTRNHFRW